MKLILVLKPKTNYKSKLQLFGKNLERCLIFIQIVYTSNVLIDGLFWLIFSLF